MSAGVFSGSATTTGHGASFQQIIANKVYGPLPVWQTSTSAAALLPAGSYGLSLTSSPTKFVALVSAISGTANWSTLTSADGATWTKTALDLQIGTQASATPSRLAYINGKFIFSVTGSAAVRVYTSTDGTSWTMADTGLTNRFVNAWTYFNGTYAGVLSRSGGSELRALTSTDGSTWSIATLATGLDVEPGLFASSPTKALIGTTGILDYGSGPNPGLFAGENFTTTWTSSAVPGGGMFGLTSLLYGNGTFLGSGVKTLVSANGSDWTLSLPGPPNSSDSNTAYSAFSTVIFSSGAFYGASSFPGSGTLLRSTDGQHWTRAVRPPADAGLQWDGNNLAVANGIAVGAVYPGGVLSSPRALIFCPVETGEGLPAVRPPYVTSEPRDVSGAVGTNLSLSGGFSGGGQVASLQWYKNEVPLAGQTYSFLSFFPVTADHAGQYTLRATNGAGTTSSRVATVSIAGTRQTQTINFAALPGHLSTDAPFTVSASSTSGLPVTITVFSGPATITGNTVTLTGTAGTVTLRAIQAGNTAYFPATTVDQSFTVIAPVVTPPPTTAQTINFDPPTKVTYGASPLTLAATATSGLPVGFERVSGPATLNGTTLTITGVGKIVIKATRPAAGIYKASTVSRTITVEKASLTATANNAERLIGRANPAFTVRYNGFVNGDDENDLTTRPTASCKAGPTSAQGNYQITVAGGAAANYVLKQVAGQLTVTGFGGTYEALLMENDATPAGKLTLTVNGYAYSGTLQLAREAKGITIKSLPSAPLVPQEDDFAASGTWTRTTSGVDALSLALTVRLDGTLSGTLVRNGQPFADLENGARLQTFAKGAKAPGAGANTLTLFPAYVLFDENQGPIPGGSGHATAAIAAATGELTLKGFLADGSPLTATLRPTRSGPANSTYLLWANPYNARPDSFIAGVLPIQTHPDQTRFAGRHYVPFASGLFTWEKAGLPTVPAPKTPDASYRAGFGPLGLQVALDPWLPPSTKATTAPVIPAGTLAQRLVLAPSGGLTLIHGPESLNLGAREALLPFEGSLSTAGVLTATGAASTAWTIKLVPTTGAFTGSFQLSDQVTPPPAKPTTRTVTFSGTLRQAPSGEVIVGAGFFLVPGFAKSDERPSGEIRFTSP